VADHFSYLNPEEPVATLDNASATSTATAGSDSSSTMTDSREPYHVIPDTRPALSQATHLP